MAAAANASGALALEDLLEGRGLQGVRKVAGGGLLTGLGARITRASALPSRSSGTARESLSTGVGELDRLLSGGLPRGGFVEIVARRSSGRFSLALSVLASATSCGETAALVDMGGHLDPQSAEDAGVDLTRLLWVRPEKLKHAVAAAEMLLTTGFALVVVDLGVPPVRGRFVPDAAWVRLERAARDRGAALLLLSPYRVGATAEAVVALDASSPVWRGERGAPPMLSGIGARITLQKDASAREGARGALRLTVDPVLFGAADATSFRTTGVDAGGRRGRPYENKDDVRPACHPERSEGSLSDGRSESAALPAREGSLVAAAARDDGGGAPRENSEGASRERGWPDSPLPVTHPRPAGRPPSDPVQSLFPCNPTPTSAVFPVGDGMTPFQPPSPIPGEGGSFFSAPFSAPSAAVQLSLLP